jgi:hypothetical protein
MRAIRQMLFGVLVGFVVLGVAAASESNLAASGIASAGTSYSGFGASRANDGNTSSTDWAAADANNTWWMVDLGATYNITHTVIYPWSDSATYYYKIETSPDGSAWTTQVDNTSSGKTGATLTDNFSSVSAQYVRITYTGASGGNWDRAWEIQVWGTGGGSVSGSTNYVSNSGDDSYPGTQAQPWRTIAKVNAQTFFTGETVLFNGGDVFAGPIVAQSGVTYGSYGSGRATISSSGNNDGFEATDVDRFTLQDLVFAGNGGISTGYGVLILNDKADETLLSGITLSNLTISNYGKAGIEVLGGYGGSGRAGFDNLTLQNCTVHDCTPYVSNAGIWIQGKYGSATANHATFTNVQILDCIVHDCPGGSGHSNWAACGILLTSCTDGLIQRCVTYNTGLNGTSGFGGFGVLAYDTRNVVISESESYSNAFTQEGNGGGFSLGGGNYNSTIEYCYAHDNQGPGFHLVSYADGTVVGSSNATVRFCIAYNNRTVQPWQVWREYSGAGIIFECNGPATFYAYNNTFVNNNPAPGNTSLIEIEEFGLADPTSVSGYVANNIFYSTDDCPFTSMGASGSTGNAPPNLLFAGNDWFSTGATVWKWNGSTYSGAAAFSNWQTATGQEKISGANAGLTSDPMLVNPSGGTTVGGYNPAALSAFTLQSLSPMIGVGRNLLPEFGIDPGPHDFYGVALPTNGTAYNVGAAESGNASTGTTVHGIPYTWLESYGITNTSDSVETQHMSGHSLDVLQDYIAGMNPTNPNNCFSVGITNSAGQIIVRMPSVQATGSNYTGKARYYDVELRTNLLSGSWQLAPNYTGILANGSIIVLTNVTPDQTKFYRAKVRLQ